MGGAGGKRGASTHQAHKEPQPTYPVSWGFTCAPGGIRTPNLLIRSQMLYPLSYGRKFHQAR